MTTLPTVATGAPPRALVALETASTLIVATGFIVVGLLSTPARGLAVAGRVAGGRA